jgi:hypothetical protein
MSRSGVSRSIETRTERGAADIFVRADGTFGFENAAAMSKRPRMVGRALFSGHPAEAKTRPTSNCAVEGRVAR